MFASNCLILMEGLQGKRVKPSILDTIIKLGGIDRVRNVYVPDAKRGPPDVWGVRKDSTCQKVRY